MGKIKDYILFLAVLLTVSSCSCGGREEQQSAADYQSIDTLPMLIMQIQKCSRLYTTEFHIHKIVTHDDVVKLQGSLLKQSINIRLPLGDRKVAIPMDATLKGYIDFSDFSEKNVRRRGKKIEILLPDPKVELTSSKIDHQEIKKQVSILRGNFTDEEMSNYEKQGRAAILNDIPKLGIIGMAQENAANTLIPMIKQMGYEEKDITITFRKQFTLDDLPTLLDAKSIAR